MRHVSPWSEDMSDHCRTVPSGWGSSLIRINKGVRPPRTWVVIKLTRLPSQWPVNCILAPVEPVPNCTHSMRFRSHRLMLPPSNPSGPTNVSLMEQPLKADSIRLLPAVDPVAASTTVQLPSQKSSCLCSAAVQAGIAITAACNMAEINKLLLLRCSVGNRPGRWRTSRKTIHATIATTKSEVSDSALRSELGRYRDLYAGRRRGSRSASDIRFVAQARGSQASDSRHAVP